NIHRLNSSETGEIVSVVTESGIEGNYTLGNRDRTTGWLEWAKPTLVGKNVLDLLPVLTATSGMKSSGGFNTRARTTAPAQRPATGNFVAVPNRSGGSWPDYKAAAADICLWDILGKAVNRPIYQLLGGKKDRMMAYASSQHLPSIEDYVPDALKAKEQGYPGYKIHPGSGQHKDGPPIPTYIGHMEEIKQLRKALGDEYVLAHDPVQQYNRFEALKVGRLLDELDYLWFEDPIRTADLEGLVELANALDVPLHVGEFLASISDFAEYIRRGAVDVVRLIADNVGGISGSMRVGLLADAFGLECTPHNWGNVIDLAVHFHLELALPNAYWFEMPHPAEYADRPYHKDRFRVDKDGYIAAPTAPGLGYPIDRDALDKMTKRIDA
ncbi:MAG: mandelate racemase/muconate lactonizing enzyme family protein, partial [Bryobacteraceae bacterium]